MAAEVEKGQKKGKTDSGMFREAQRLRMTNPRDATEKGKGGESVNLRPRLERPQKSTQYIQRFSVKGQNLESATQFIEAVAEEMTGNGEKKKATHLQSELLMPILLNWEKLNKTDLAEKEFDTYQEALLEFMKELAKADWQSSYQELQDTTTDQDQGLEKYLTTVKVVLVGESHGRSKTLNTVVEATQDSSMLAMEIDEIKMAQFEEKMQNSAQEHENTEIGTEMPQAIIEMMPNMKFKRYQGGSTDDSQAATFVMAREYYQKQNQPYVYVDTKSTPTNREKAVNDKQGWLARRNVVMVKNLYSKLVESYTKASTEDDYVRSVVFICGSDHVDVERCGGEGKTLQGLLKEAGIGTANADIQEDNLETQTNTITIEIADPYTETLNEQETPYEETYIQTGSLPQSGWLLDTREAEEYQKHLEQIEEQRQKNEEEKKQRKLKGKNDSSSSELYSDEDEGSELESGSEEDGSSSSDYY
ncbi:MAG: hypothetical protein F6J87_19245 [Spirulina sp. SIO3F2]|nr:hypothetical protein [Spirulina sp. SIO3F2]